MLSCFAEWHHCTLEALDGDIGQGEEMYFDDADRGVHDERQSPR